MIYELKILSSFVKPILNGSKTFEIRENNWGFQKGDKVQFKVISDDWTCKNSSIVYELEHKIFEITYVINGWGLKNGFVAFGIKEKIKKMTEFSTFTDDELDMMARDCHFVKKMKVIHDEISIPDNATNGDVIKALFPDYKTEIDSEQVICFKDDNNWISSHPDWWNASYKAKSEE